MQVTDNEQIYYFDVDDTLVLWDDGFQKPGPDRVEIIDPYDGIKVYLKPHVRHVKLLKQMFGRGRHIIVHSAGGAQWAANVVRALGLVDFVHEAKTKPIGYVDDLPCKAWMQNHIYIEPGPTEQSRSSTNEEN